MKFEVFTERFYALKVKRTIHHTADHEHLEGGYRYSSTLSLTLVIDGDVCEPVSSVGIATDYELEGPGSNANG